MHETLQTCVIKVYINSSSLAINNPNTSYVTKNDPFSLSKFHFGRKLNIHFSKQIKIKFKRKTVKFLHVRRMCGSKVPWGVSRSPMQTFFLFKIDPPSLAPSIYAWFSKMFISWVKLHYLTCYIVGIHNIVILVNREDTEHGLTLTLTWLKVLKVEELAVKKRTF